MMKFSDRYGNGRQISSIDSRILTGWIYDVEPYSRVQPKSFDDVKDDLRLKKMLKRAVEKIETPQSLIDSIRSEIRK